MNCEGCDRENVGLATIWSKLEDKAMVLCAECEREHEGSNDFRNMGPEEVVASLSKYDMSVLMVAGEAFMNGETMVLPFSDRRHALLNTFFTKSEVERMVTWFHLVPGGMVEA